MARFIGKVRCDESLENFDGGCQILVDGAEAQDVRAHMLARLLRVGHAAAERRAHVLETVGGHAHAHAVRADEHAQVRFALGDGFGHGVRIVRIVAGLLLRTAQISPFGGKSLLQLLLELKSAMVGCD